MNDIYYNYDKVLSYNALFNFIIGERGVGKSYGSKLLVAKNFIKNGDQFVYIRRYKTELKESMMKSKTPIFFNQIQNDEYVKNHKLSNNKDTFYIDDKLCGYAIPLSTSNILKSSTFDKVTIIIFDEFIINQGCYHYLQNEVIQFLELYETISRLRNVKVLFLGNAISITNPYFNYFNISLPYNSEFKVSKKTSNGDPLILINYIKNLKYREVKNKTKFGELIKNTDYGKYAIDNQMLNDSKSFINKKTKTSKFYFILVLNSKYFGIWCDYKIGMMYISNDYDPNCPVKFSINSNDHNENTLLIRCRTSPFFKSIIEHYRLARLNFENQKIKNQVMNSIVKFIRY